MYLDTLTKGIRVAHGGTVLLMNWEFTLLHHLTAFLSPFAVARWCLNVAYLRSAIVVINSSLL